MSAAKGEGGLAQMRTNMDKVEWGSDCMGTSTTLLGIKASRAGIQQCTAILITTTVTVLAVLNRPLWSLNLRDLRCDMQRRVSHKPSRLYNVCRCGRPHRGRRVVSQMRTKVDKEARGLKIA